MAVLNGEIIAGLAILLMGILFLVGSALNPLWQQINFFDFILIALGAVTIGIGVWTIFYDKKHAVHAEHHH